MPAHKKKPAKRSAKAPDKTKPKAAVVRKLTQGTLLAISLGATQFGGDPANSEWKVFDCNVVDRLHAPLTRYHE